MVSINPLRRRKSTSIPKPSPTSAQVIPIMTPTSTLKPPRDCHKHAATISSPPEGFDLPPRGSLNTQKAVYLDWRLNIIYDSRRAEYEQEDSKRSRSSSSSSSSGSSSGSSFATLSTARSSYSQQQQQQQQQQQGPIIIHPDNITAIAAAAGASPPTKRPLISSHYASHKLTARTALNTTLRLTDDEIDDKYAFYSVPILTLDPKRDSIGSLHKAVLAAGQQDEHDDIEILREEDEEDEAQESYDEEDEEEEDADSISTTTSSSAAESLPSKPQPTSHKLRAKKFLSLIGLRAEAAAAVAGAPPKSKSKSIKVKREDLKVAHDEHLADLRFQTGLWF